MDAIGVAAKAFAGSHRDLASRRRVRENQARSGTDRKRDINGLVEMRNFRHKHISTLQRQSVTNGKKPGQNEFYTNYSKKRAKGSRWATKKRMLLNSKGNLANRVSGLSSSRVKLKANRKSKQKIKNLTRSTLFSVSKLTHAKFGLSSRVKKYNRLAKDKPQNSKHEFSASYRNFSAKLPLNVLSRSRLTSTQNQSPNE